MPVIANLLVSVSVLDLSWVTLNSSREP